jgi:glycerol-3-phosphate acyltransferase PlsY
LRAASHLLRPPPMTPELILSLVIGYALGSIPFGLLLTRLGGKGDIRAIGSGNIGATNVLRTGSKGLAAATLILDALKGAAAVLLAQRFWPDGVQFAAAGAMIGHLYPIWLKFQGGKGVATLLGVIAPLLWWQGPAIYALLWVGLLLTVRISSVAGMVAAATAPLSAAVLGKDEFFPMMLGFALLVVWKHRPNIQRLFAGTEPKIGAGAG